MRKTLSGVRGKPGIEVKGGVVELGTHKEDAGHAVADCGSEIHG